MSSYFGQFSGKLQAHKSLIRSNKNQTSKLNNEIFGGSVVFMTYTLEKANSDIFFQPINQLFGGSVVFPIKNNKKIVWKSNFKTFGGSVVFETKPSGVLWYLGLISSGILLYSWAIHPPDQHK